MPLRRIVERHRATGPKFLVVGALNTLTGLAVIYGLKWVFEAHDVTANLVGYAIGVTVSFALNSQWTFRHAGKLAPAFARFIFVLIGAYLLNLATVLVAINVLAINSYIAQALGIIPYTLCTYLCSKYYVFNAASSRDVDPINRESTSVKDAG